MERIRQTGMERRYGTGVWNGCGPGPCSGPYNLTCTHFQPLPCTHAVRSRPRNSPIHARQRSSFSAQFSPPFCRPQPSAQPSSLISSGFFSPPISSHSVAPTPSAAVRAVFRTHFPSTAVCAAKLAHHQRLLLPTHHQRLLLPTHFQPLCCTHAVRSRQPSAQFSAPISRPQPSAQPSSLISSSFLSRPISSHSPAPTLSAAVHAILSTHLPSAAVRAAKLAHHQRLLLPDPFPATPLHPRCPQPSAQFSARISRPQPFAQPSSLITSGYFSPTISSHRPQPSAQPSSLISSGFFSPPISSHSLAPTPSAAVRAILPTHLPSAAVRAGKLAHHQQLLLPTHFRCTHALRNRPRSSPRPFPVRSRPRSQARSSPAASSPHPFPATPLHPRRPQPSAQFSAPISSHFPSAAVRAAKLADLQRLLLPTHFQQLPGTHAVRSRPRNSPHPLPSAQPSSLISSGFFSPPISSHSLAPTPSAAVRAVFRTHFPSAAIRAAKLAHHQRLLLPNHFQPPLHPRRPQPSAQPNSLISSGFFSHSFLSFLSLPFPSCPFLSPSFPILSLPFPSFPFLSLPVPSFPFLSLPFPCTHAVRTPPFKPARSPTRLNN